MWTVQQFVDHFYATTPPAQRTFEVNRLQALHVRTIVERNWITAPKDEVDIALLSFGTATDAQSRAFAVERAYDNRPNYQPMPAGTFPLRVVAYSARTPDSLGLIHAAAFGHFGNIEMDVFFFSPTHLNNAAFTDLVNHQAGLLK